MYYIYPDKSYKKKIRGKTRKFKEMECRLIELTSKFPDIDLEHGMLAFTHAHISTIYRFLQNTYIFT